MKLLRKFDGRNFGGRF